jgi:hypothetical protein
MDPGEATKTQRLPTTSDIALIGLQRDIALRHDLSPVMVDTLARVKAGTHTYPTRVRPLIRRGLVADDGRGLTEAGASVADGLEL